MLKSIKKYIKNTINIIKKLLIQNKGSIVLSLFFLFIIFVGYIYYKNFTVLKDPKNIKNIILSYGNYGIVVFLLFQIIQVVAFFIPGEVIQISGGYIYGTLFGSIYSLIGITLGSVFVFLLSHIYGRPLVHKIICKKDLKFFDRLLNIGSIKLIVFLLYLIPGIPKDALGYICGISDIKFKDFFVLSTLGRIPGVLASTYFGANIHSGNKSVLIIVGVVSSLLFIIGVLKGEKIIKKIGEK
ncbi:TVP38/TMEM64 family protein [Clostridium sporogenes]|uniref:TVP38/TMEM64 family membrane protein n=1 Tax=Clostridium botulinum TaxID=1491 RepID=A0A6M0T1T7_CLOBO|nr:TVP38/TMEM64 family protein [Clostridium sporogenes]NFA61484.1 TVP38/TMEM64 family protein [Clostridium botulinum]NFI74603.1 TVP38/TMEM64 family protein [Clostridium sporogenes]NFP62535.1 TVP38/TMEM64 family protein [Clostridium sporogenes]NFU95781.1 TVP38/TMEM64 family protein [Clostridium sporogenes]NFV70749.1 TVP38/TMEM64 family protein [Clostridium botulinum]